jgi:hypothetical protein
MESTFVERLQELINSYSMENGSDTPDWLLAQYLTDCLAAFDKATKERDRWYRFSALRNELGVAEERLAEK